MNRLRAVSPVAAYAAEVQPATLRKWVQRGHISPPVNGLYDLEEILAWSDRRCHSRAVNARYQRGSRRVVLPG